jgi:hypothetical protein
VVGLGTCLLLQFLVLLLKFLDLLFQPHSHVLHSLIFVSEVLYASFVFLGGIYSLLPKALVGLTSRTLARTLEIHHSVFDIFS